MNKKELHHHRETMGRQRQDRERGQENKSLFRGEVIDGKLMKLAEKDKQNTDSTEELNKHEER